MSLNRFLSGRIHQMRSGKSYLAAQSSWFNRDTSPLCPMCEESDEDLAHAILTCPARADECESHIPGIDSVDPDSPLWSSRDNLKALAAYIIDTRTGYPPAMLHAHTRSSSFSSDRSGTTTSTVGIV